MPNKPDEIAIQKLLLDPTNPRFGELDRHIGQSSILNMIVERFGVEDVLSSLSINGFFSAEPLICKDNLDGTYTVKEGNRRLAACLIILGDDRAAAHHSLHRKYNETWIRHKRPKITPIPVIVFDGSDSNEKLLSYLGVRHISSAQPWDSYAKAAWVAELSRLTSLSVSEISEMIGDQHRTVLRLLEGYNFIKQAIAENVFFPEQSVRRGRGSVTEYPFSWIYTLLGYKAARGYLGLQDMSAADKPIPVDKIGNAGLALSALYGDSRRGRNSAVSDSRQISALAEALSDPIKVNFLREGKNIDEIGNLTKPIEQKIQENLSEARMLLSNLIVGLSETPPNYEVALENIPNSKQVRSLAVDVEKKLIEITVSND